MLFYILKTKTLTKVTYFPKIFYQTHTKKTLGSYIMQCWCHSQVHTDATLILLLVVK